MNYSVYSILLLLMFAGALAHAREIKWQIIQTKYPTADVVIAGLNVQDFGADATGSKDCTSAFQKALDTMGEAGGGTVFVPEGYYRFNGTLEIPVSVTLRGEWQAPTSESPTVKGTVLMPTAGKGRADGQPFITVDFCAGIKDMNIWYPEQTLPTPTPYPFCLYQKRADNATFENLTLVNPYQGIRIGPGSNELHLVRNVYGTPLKTGVWYDSTTDIGRLQTINFAPFWWARSGLKDAPQDFSWIRKNGTGIFMGRSDWEYVANVLVNGYHRGFHISKGARGAANAQFYRLILRNCEIGMEVEETNPYGMVFTQCFFEGTRYGVLVDEPFKSTIMFSNCIFRGAEAIHSNGRGKILLEQCKLMNGNLVVIGGVLTALNTDLSPNCQFDFSGNVQGAALGGDQDWSKLTLNKPSGDIIKTSRQTLRLNPIAEYPKDPHKAYYPANRANLVVVEPSDDDAKRIHIALRRMASRGGGTVFLPAGDYRIKGNLTIPSGVELRGVHDVPHHTMGGGSVLHIYPSSDEPTITLQKKSGLRGLSFYYPTQDINAVKPFPALIQGNGSDIYVINVNAANPYYFIDFMTHRCDNHYIDYASGSPLMTGIAIGGGSEDGLLMNLQFNPHYWNRTPRSNSLYANSTSGGIRSGSGALLWEYQKENLDALIIGHCKRQFLYQNFVYGSLYGIHFTQQDGEGAIECLSHGHGTDGSKIGVFFEHGHGTITMVNSELVAMSSTNKTAIKVGADFDSEATLINTMVWGQPDLLAEVLNGTLILQNMHANRHGDGLRLTGGKLRGYNLSFNENNARHLSVAQGAQAELMGVITTGRFGSHGTGRKVDLLIERN